MLGAEFRRARTYVRSIWLRLALYGAATLAALLAAVVVLQLGVIVQMFAARGVSTNLVAALAEFRLDRPAITFWLPADRRLAALLFVVAGMLTAVAHCLALLLCRRIAQRLAAQAQTQIRVAIIRQAYRLGTVDPLGDRHTRPEQLCLNEGEQLRRGLSAWWTAIPYCPIVLAAFLALALSAAFWLAVLATLLVYFIWQRFVRFRDLAERARRYWDKRIQDSRSRLLDQLRLIPLSISYGRNGSPDSPEQPLLDELEYAESRRGYTFVDLTPGLLTIVAVAAGFLLMVVSLSQQFTVARVILLGSALLAGFFPAARLYRLPLLMREAERAAGEIFRYLSREPGVAQTADAVPLTRLQDSLKLQDVTLADAHGQRLLNQVSFQVAKGQRVALVSTRQLAATALAGLLVRLYDPAAGHILYDGQDIEQCTLDTLRQQILLVPSDGTIFRGSANDNIRCGDSRFTVLQITDAAKQARAYNFLQELPQGLATLLGDEGHRLLPGQAFRVGLARALIRNPSVLIILEPRDPLDERSAAHIEEALRLSANGRTVLIVPSRISTLRWVDRVILLHEGRVVAQGPHAELLQTSEEYRHVNYLQFAQHPA